jgi:hypothetical protein
MFSHKRHRHLLRVRFLGTSEGRQGKETKKENQIFSIKSPSLWLIFACWWFNSSYFCIVKFDTIQAMVGQFGQAVDFQKL